MIIVIDSNEYIIYLNKENLLLQKLFLNKKLSININDHIIREVLRNLSELQQKEFYDIVFKYNLDFHAEKLPVHLVDKYKNLGLKKGDIEIAAFSDDINVEYLVSENRHFLKGVKFDKFKVISLADFVKKI